MYLELNDREMDIWIKVTKRDLLNPKPRSLHMTVTVVKKDCVGGPKAHPNQWQTCPGTNYCIREEFFCDGRVNCVGGKDESLVMCSH